MRTLCVCVFHLVGCFIFTYLFSTNRKTGIHTHTLKQYTFFAATEIPHHFKWEFFRSFADDIKGHTHTFHSHREYRSEYKFIQKRVFTSNLPQLIKCDVCICIYVCSLLIDWIACLLAWLGVRWHPMSPYILSGWVLFYLKIKEDQEQ